ncbi:---NA---, partial [Paramuricea clavata]
MPDSETDQFCSYLHAQSKEKLTENLPTKLLAINDEVENQVVATVSDQGSPHHSPSCAQKMPDSETDSYLNTQSKEKLTENLPTKLLAINDEVQNQVVATVSDQGSPHHSPSCAQK